MAQSGSLEAIYKALEFEREGEAYYNDSAARVKHPETHSVLKMLAEEELTHVEFLENFVEVLSDSGKLPDKVTIDIERDFKLIFKEASATIDTDAKVSLSETEALDFALKMETKGHTMYLDLSGKATDPKEKELFAFLAGWEEKHAAFIEDYLNFYQDHGMFTED
jgi:erythrin-vacuolar iron transport family protein